MTIHKMHLFRRIIISRGMLLLSKISLVLAFGLSLKSRIPPHVHLWARFAVDAESWIRRRLWEGGVDARPCPS